MPENQGLTARALLGPLIADAPIGLALVDAEFRYVFINATQAGFNELPVAEHQGQTVRDILGDATWEQLAPFFARSLSGQALRAQEVTYRSLRQPETQRHYLVSFYPVRSDRRTVTGVGTVVTDITERKQSEALIAGQNHILEGIATDAPLLQTLTSLAALIEEQLPNISTLFLQTQSETERLDVVTAPRISPDAVQRIIDRLEAVPHSTVDEEGAWPGGSLILPLSGEPLEADVSMDSPMASATCWITPILGENDALLGAFAVLLEETRDPTPREHSLVNGAVHTARIAMERDREMVRRRQLLGKMLGSLTEGRLVLCLLPRDLPTILPTSCGETMMLSKEVLRDLRRSVNAAAEGMSMPDERRYDLEAAVGEASMNAVVHAGTGTAEVFADLEAGRIQVWIRDAGPGIAEESLHRATLERGFSTGGTLGHGFWMILNTIDKMYLLTGPEGTTIVLEHNARSQDPDWMSIM
jgi:anti-sigma regulatory factor (Ser/Thr protein kinase)